MIQYFATVAHGLEDLAAQELKNLGAENIKVEFTGVSFTGTQETLYQVNLWSRLIFRVLMPIKVVKALNGDQLHDHVKQIDWSEYFTPQQTFAVNCTGKNKNLNHSHFTALQIKNAIVDQQREKTGKRSYIDIENPDFLINGHIIENRCIISLDSSGYSLHRRGYRPAMGLAPLKETLACALLEIAQWQPDIPFLDPLCGSGTLPIEAGLKSLNIAPGLYRDEFAFQKWRDYDQKLWLQLVKKAKEQQKTEFVAPIFGSDRDAEVLQQAQINARVSKLNSLINFQQKELAEIEAPTDQGIIICNPPYGQRIGEEQELESLYKLLGDTFKQKFKGWTAYVLTGNKNLAKKIGLKPARRIPINNGALPCTFLKYEMW
jgi:putative N6-adenine-specific DNA methylase